MHTNPHFTLRCIFNSLLAVVLTLVKTYVGSGILGLPFAFENGGILAGIIVFPIICLLSVHCTHLLINAKEYFVNKTNRISKASQTNATYEEIQAVPHDVKSFHSVNTSEDESIPINESMDSTSDDNKDNFIIVTPEDGKDMIEMAKEITLFSEVGQKAFGP